MISKKCKPTRGGDIVEERITYAKIVNYMLRDDEKVKEYIPVNTLDDSLYYIFENGIVLCQLMKQIDDKCIDEKKINTSKGINAFQ